MVRYLADVDRRRGVFLCDDCGRPLYRNDRGFLYFPDNENFLEDAEKGGDICTLIRFVCMGCFEKMKKKEKKKGVRGGYDTRADGCQMDQLIELVRWNRNPSTLCLCCDL